jgi:glucokinase
MAGDLALILDATGGVYIAGGIVPNFIAELRSGPFRAAFEAKGPMSALARSIPTYVVTAEVPALIGCAAVHRMKSGGQLSPTAA